MWVREQDLKKQLKLASETKLPSFGSKSANKTAVVVELTGEHKQMPKDLLVQSTETHPKVLIPRYSQLIYLTLLKQMVDTYTCSVCTQKSLMEFPESNKKSAKEIFLLA